MDGRVIDILRHDRTDDPRLRAEGLAPVMCYDPWFGRALETIKQTLRDGNPLLIRLHTGAMYPTSEGVRYRADLESHAVMVVGYDDEAKVLFLRDPWDTSMGGAVGGSWTIGYEDFLVLNVDASLGITTGLTPLQVQANGQRDEDGNLILNTTAGFYVPMGTVVDRGTFVITEIEFDFEVRSQGDAHHVRKTVAGTWTVGDEAEVSVAFGAVGDEQCDVSVTARATISGKRPYEFADRVSSSIRLAVPAVASGAKLVESGLIG